MLYTVYFYTLHSYSSLRVVKHSPVCFIFCDPIGSYILSLPEVPEQHFFLLFVGCRSVAWCYCEQLVQLSPQCPPDSAGIAHTGLQHHPHRLTIDCNVKACIPGHHEARTQEADHRVCAIKKAEQTDCSRPCRIQWSRKPTPEVTDRTEITVM